MNKSVFQKFIEVQRDRIEKGAVLDEVYLLGLMEGLGKKKLTGYQAGALIDLMLVSRDGTVQAVPSEQN